MNTWNRFQMFLSPIINQLIAHNWTVLDNLYHCEIIQNFKIHTLIFGGSPTINSQSDQIPESRRCFPRSATLHLVVCQSGALWCLLFGLGEFLGIRWIGKCRLKFVGLFLPAEPNVAISWMSGKGIGWYGLWKGLWGTEAPSKTSCLTGWGLMDLEPGLLEPLDIWN